MNLQTNSLNWPSGTCVIESEGEDGHALIYCTDVGALTTRGQLVRMVLFPTAVRFKYLDQLPIVSCMLPFRDVCCWDFRLPFQGWGRSDHWPRCVLSFELRSMDLCASMPSLLQLTNRPFLMRARQWQSFWVSFVARQDNHCQLMILIYPATWKVAKDLKRSGGSFCSGIHGFRLLCCQELVTESAQ